MVKIVNVFYLILDAQRLWLVVVNQLPYELFNFNIHDWLAGF